MKKGNFLSIYSFIQHWAYKTAKKLYHDKEIIDKQEFHLVWWDGVEKVLLLFPKMFRVWLTNMFLSVVLQTDSYLGLINQLKMYVHAVGK